MSDVSQDDTGKRARVSIRSFLDKDGKTVDTMEEAAGGRYSLIDPAGNHDKDYIFGQNENVDRMFAIFGFHTKIGNVANTVLNDKDEPGTPAKAADVIDEFLAGVVDGTWAERGGGGAIRIDKDALAGAIVEVAEAAGKTADYATIRQKLEDDAQYVRKARQVPDVAAAYAKRAGRVQKTVDDLL